MAKVTLHQVSKSFGRVQALLPLDLEIADGEFVALLGPSGCGKTTTLNLIAGLEDASSGTIFIGGRDVTRVPAMEREIAMVFQSYALYPHMTVARNMGFALTVRRMPPAEIRAKVQRAAEVLDLVPYLDRYPRQLSGGQRQRVALGRALVRDPQVFLLDEPLSNLDAVLRLQTRAEIVRLFRSLGTTAIYVTHDQAEAMTMADRIAVFSAGRLLQFAAPLDVYLAPVNRFVAGFLGAPPMQFADAVAAPGGVAFGGHILPCTAPLQPGAPVTLGLRPENLHLGPEGRGLPAEVDIVEHLGGLQIVYLRCGGATFSAQTGAGMRYRPGERLGLTVDPASVYLFDPATGTTLAAPGLAPIPRT